jgi:hypothetical protein
MVTWADKVQACVAILSLLASIGSAAFVVLSLRQTAHAIRSQNTSSDVNSVLTLWERLDHHWVRFKAASDEKAIKFEFGQLIGYYEMSCAWFNKKAFSTSASEMLFNHLKDVLRVMKENEKFSSLFKSLVSDGETYKEINQFLECLGLKPNQALDSE